MAAMLVTSFDVDELYMSALFSASARNIEEFSAGGI